MPDLSDTVAKCRMGTAKKFYTSIASLSHTSKKSGHEAADGWRRRCPDRYHSGAPSVRSVRLIRSRNKHSLTHKYTSKLTLAAAYGTLTNGFQVCAGSLFQTKGDFTMEFFNSAVDVLKTLVVALGAGLGVWGAVNLMEGYGGDNPSANAHIR